VPLLSITNLTTAFTTVGTASQVVSAHATAALRFTTQAAAVCSLNASAVSNLNFTCRGVSSGNLIKAIVTWPPITASASAGNFTPGPGHLVYFDEDDRQIYFGAPNDRAYSLLSTRRAA